jgi:hypothetical protein
MPGLGGPMMPPQGGMPPGDPVANPIMRQPGFGGPSITPGGPPQPMPPVNGGGMQPWQGGPVGAPIQRQPGFGGPMPPQIGPDGQPMPPQQPNAYAQFLQPQNRPFGGQMTMQ